MIFMLSWYFLSLVSSAMIILHSSTSSSNSLLICFSRSISMCSAWTYIEGWVTFFCISMFSYLSLLLFCFRVSIMTYSLSNSIASDYSFLWNSSMVLVRLVIWVSSWQIWSFFSWMADVSCSIYCCWEECSVVELWFLMSSSSSVLILYYFYLISPVRFSICCSRFLCPRSNDSMSDVFLSMCSCLRLYSFLNSMINDLVSLIPSNRVLLCVCWSSIVSKLFKII